MIKEISNRVFYANKLSFNLADKNVCTLQIILIISKLTLESIDYFFDYCVPVSYGYVINKTQHYVEPNITSIIK